MNYPKRNVVLAEGYIARIVNDEKRKYAELYLAFKLGTANRSLSADCKKLSYMAAQAVRMNIDSILEDK
jgi:hypothetical protein